MLKMISGAAVVAALVMPVWAQASPYGTPLQTMKIQVCSKANGSPECKGVPDWGIASQLGIPDSAEVQPGSITGQDPELEDWQAGAGRGSTGTESRTASRNGPDVGLDGGNGDTATGG